MIALLYVSTSMLPPAQAEAEVAAIVRRCEPRNIARGLTGAIVFTGTHFAQLIEGEEAVVETLLSSLRLDPRHADLTVVDRRDIATRRFASWSVAYSGPSQFVALQVSRLLDHQPPAELRRSADGLINFLLRFTTT